MCLCTITNCHYMEIRNTIHLNYIFCKNSGQKQPAPEYATVRLCSMERKQMHATYGLLFSQIVYNVLRNMCD